jgi:DNA adenine methylase
MKGGGVMALKAPFPYCGGKSKVADVVWRHFGSPKTYVEPFCGSAAVLLARPGRGNFGREIVNDYDGNIANFWRAVKYDPAGVAEFCDWPTNHIDLSARRLYLIREYDRMRNRLIADPDYYDAKIAGFWVWCTSNWIGSGLMKNRERKGDVSAIPQLAQESGIMSEGNALQKLKQLQARLSTVKVVCGDWTQVMGGNWRIANGDCAVFLDPPYAPEQGRTNDVYTSDDLTVAKDVLNWCKENGDNRLYKIALCGYDGEHNELENMGWTVHSWATLGGFANLSKGESRGKKNRFKERIWFSPFCNRELTLF